MMGFWKRLGEIVQAKGAAAVATVVEVRGSTPREAGARMIVAPDGSYSGTIGGGALEFEAIGIARQRTAGPTDAAHLRRMSLGPELGQCCGGQVVLLIESFSSDRLEEIGRLAALEAGGGLVTSARFVEGGPLRRMPAHADAAREPAPVARDGDVLVESFVDARHPVLLFGAGHVGRALVLALAPLPFRVTWIDGRADAFPAAVPPNVETRRVDDPPSAVAAADPGAFVLVMTHSHPLDLEICRATLARAQLGYVGLIGSATKRARFASRLKAGGLPPEAVGRLVCPIGLTGLTGKAPAEIAASVAADLLLRRAAVAAQPAPELAMG